VFGDQIVFGFAGISGNSIPRKRSWDAFSIARKEYSILAKRPSDDLIQKLAAAYGKRYAEKISEGMNDPKLLAYLLERKGEAGQAIFAGFNRKGQRVIVEVVAGTRFTTRLIPGDNTVATDVLGENGIAEEYAAQETQRSKDWLDSLVLKSKGMDLQDRLILQAEAIVGLTAKYHPDRVAEPTDAVLVTRNRGVKWIDRKAECESPSK
jgi:hypothetical protein